MTFNWWRVGGLGLACLVIVISSTVASGLEVQLVPAQAGQAQDAKPKAFQGTLHFQPTGGADLDETEPRTVVLDGSDRVRLDLPPNTWWMIEPEIEGWWSGPVPVSSKAALTTLRLHPAGHAEIELEPGAAPAPDRLTVRFTRSLQGVRVIPGEEREEVHDRELLSGKSACSRVTGTEAENRWRCKVPAGVPLDMKLHPRGFASVFLWELEVPQHGTKDLGSLSLQAGGSVVGWVDVPPEAQDAEVTVRLKPEAVGLPGARSKALQRKASVGRSGLFQFQDLKPGSYDIELNAPGWSTTEQGSVRVLPGRETELRRPLTLRRPATLRLCASPPAIPGYRLPEDRWEFHLQPPDGEFRDPIRGKAGEDGCWGREGVQPGEYRLLVMDGRDSRWTDEILEVPSGPFSHTVHFDLLKIKGTVRQGGEPRRAVLHFRRKVVHEDGRPGDLKVMMITDLEGRISGALPEEGEWHVGAVLRPGGAVNQLGRYEIVRPEDGEATLDLDIPGGRIEGRVTTGDGRAVVPASLWARPVGSDAERSSTETNDDGTFRFDALAPGDYKVTVLAPEGTAQADVTLHEGSEAAQIELVLTGQRQLVGRVVGDFGPVPGAQVQIHPQVEDQRPLPVQRKTTDADGIVSLDVPADTTSLKIVVLPPGHSAAVYRLAPPAEGEAPLLLSVHRQGGALVLTADGANLLLGAGKLYLDGVELWLPLLQDWARMGGGSVGTGTWVIPNMSPGEYTWCLAGQGCESGFLSPLGRLELEAREGSR